MNTICIMKKITDGLWKQNELYEKAIGLSSGYIELR